MTTYTIHDEPGIFTGELLPHGGKEDGGQAREESHTADQKVLLRAGSLVFWVVWFTLCVSHSCLQRQPVCLSESRSLLIRSLCYTCALPAQCIPYG